MYIPILFTMHWNQTVNKFYNKLWISVAFKTYSSLLKITIA